MPILGIIASADKSVPNAPTIGTATNVGTGRAYNNGRADVTFTAPAFNGKLPITSYTVKVYNSAGVYQSNASTGASSPITLTGLSSGVDYKYTVYATNGKGNSAESGFSNLVTATTVPQAPTIGTATAGSSSATVAYTAGATGGAAVSTYTATSTPGTLTGTGASPITVSGLTNGTAYTFKVKATNANGTSLESAASNSVTPIVPVTSTVEYLVVAGGGSSGTDGFGPTGAGGGGGYRTATGFAVSAGTPLTVTIGAGGSLPSNGANSVFSSITSTGGGAGGQRDSNGSAGGSGGGGGYASATSTTGGAASPAGQGNAGGNATVGSGGSAAGGGAGGVGASRTTTGLTLAGGIGLYSSISGTSTGYAGGGGNTATEGGGGSNTGGTANTGGGGGQGGGPNPARPGGSGIVIIRYSNIYNDAVSTTGSPTYLNSGGYKIYKWTGSGSITF